MLLQDALAHRLALNLNGIGVVDEPVIDDVGQDEGIEILMPLAGVMPGAEDGRVHLVLSLFQFQHIRYIRLGDRAVTHSG